MLKANPLGDPSRRPLWVYLPPGYDQEPARRYASVYLIQGLTGQLDMWRNRLSLRKNFPELVDELFAAGQAPPCLIVWVDAGPHLAAASSWTPRLLVATTPTCATRSCPGSMPTIAPCPSASIAGKSSGGYGAMVTPMLRPDLWGGLATHAGDALFEVCYLPAFPQSVRALRDDYQGSFERFWQDLRSRPAFSRESDLHLLNDWCMAACYSADPDGTIHLPYDLSTGHLLPEVWERWLAWDPVRMVAAHAADLRQLKAIYIDAGKRDEFFLDLGAEAFRQALEHVGITDILFELFDATHRDIEYRYPLSLQYLAERLSWPR